MGGEGSEKVQDGDERVGPRKWSGEGGAYNCERSKPTCPCRLRFVIIYTPP